MKLGYYKQLDGVRAIAALMVMFYHFFSPIHAESRWLQMVTKYSVFGQTGVSLFFVLSGFLITRILLVTKTSPSYFKDFYARRALRIFPLYYLFLLIFYFVAPFLLNTQIVSFGKQVYDWVYLQNFAMTFNWPSNGPAWYWSLAVEEHFYLLWPCLVFFLSNKGIKWAIASLLVLALGCRVLLLLGGHEVFYFTFTRLDEIVVGGLLAVWESEGKLKNASRKFLYVLVITLVPTIIVWLKVTGKAIPAIQAIKFNLLGICYFCVVGFIIASKQSNSINRVLSKRFFSFTGKISYGLYVYHPLCFILIAALLPDLSLLPRLVVSIVSAYLVAYLSYHYFEARFIALKNRFAYDRKAVPAKTASEKIQLDQSPSVPI